MAGGPGPGEGGAGRGWVLCYGVGPTLLVSKQRAGWGPMEAAVAPNTASSLGAAGEQGWREEECVRSERVNCKVHRGRIEGRRGERLAPMLPLILSVCMTALQWSMEGKCVGGEREEKRERARQRDRERDQLFRSMPTKKESRVPKNKITTPGGLLATVAFHKD